MKINTSGRVALITGANRGIGLQTAKDLGPDRVFLLLGVRNLAKGQAVAERMRNEGFEVETVHLNVTDPSTHGEVYDFIDGVFGRLDIRENMESIGGLLGSELRSFALVRHISDLIQSSGLRRAEWWLRAAATSGRAYARRDFRGHEVDHLYAPWLLHAGLSPDNASGGPKLSRFDDQRLWGLQ